MIGVVYARQPVYNLLALIVVFFVTILLYIYAGAEFLAFLFLIVYVGAIAILFLFVIILLQLKDSSTSLNQKMGVGMLLGSPVVAALLLICEDYLTQMFNELLASRSMSGPDNITSLLYYINYKFSDIFVFSSTLYSSHSFLLFLAGLLLLSAMLGAIALAISAVEDQKSTSN